jgi:EpsI family protein
MSRRLVSGDLRTRVAVMLLLLCVTAAATWSNPPRRVVAEQQMPVDLATWIPDAFAAWRLDASVNVVPLSFIAAAEAETVYVQTLERVYVDDQSRRIMLSLAYGDRQEGDLQAHRPEFCFKAQGFQLAGLHDLKLDTGLGEIPLRRMEARRPGRTEPVSYWLTIGEQPTLPGVRRKLAQLRHGLTGETPDGVLIRISSLDEVPGRAYAVHDEFIRDLLAGLAAEHRRRLAGAPG